MAVTTPKPGRFVPTLTQRVNTAPASTPVSAPPSTPASVLELPELSKDAREELVMRVMQRLDLALEQSLPAAISQLVLEHMQALGPRLWDEVGAVVRQSVVQAVTRELETRSSKE